MCAAPKPFNEKYTGVEGPKGCNPDNNDPSCLRDPWVFDLATGGYINFTESNLHGYNMHDICGKGINPAIAVTFPPGTIFPPPPPLYSAAKGTPKGCQAISPLPTLLKQLDLDLIAVWIILIVFLFYALAMVCEEFLVPAINILCVKTGIPDDVAGATLLAAGCNSPEFFASIIGIYVADSTVGVGTVLGSAPFNLCCITGGAALAMGGALWLDPWLMARELLGLLFALLLFLVFMDDYIVEWWEALIMVLYYCCIYVPVLGYFDKIKAFLLRMVAGRYSGSGSDAMLEDDEPNLLGISRKTGSSKIVDVERVRASSQGGQISAAASVTSAFEGLSGHLAKSLSKSLAGTQRVTFGMKDMLRASASGESLRHFAQTQQMSVELQPVALMPPGDAPMSAKSRRRDSFAAPADMPRLSDLVEQCKKRCAEYPNAEDGFEGILMKKPRGYVKVRVRGILWQERHFVLDNHPSNPFRYSHKERLNKFVTLPLQDVTHIERVGLEEMHLTTASETYMLRLPSGESPETMQRWFDQIVVKIDEMGFAPPPPSELVGGMDDDELTEHDHPPWYKWPTDGSATSKFLHICTFPIKGMVFTTTPNVLIKKNEKWYPLTIMVSMFWLAIFAILMTDVIEYLGCGIGIDATVMGLSLGAIGTSFPNLYASILVARAGQGGMAICQAIASNTFNICICLAMLWLFHTIGLGTCDYGSHGMFHGTCSGCYAPAGFKPLCPFVEGTNNEFGSAPGSTKGAVIVSLFWVAFFLVTLAVSDMHVRKPAAYMMFAIYALYIVYQFIAAFATGFKLCFPSVNICI